MKLSANTFITGLVDTAKKLFFCSQLVIISLALPSLFVVGVTYNNQLNGDNVHKKVIMTNKGKKILVTDEKAGDAAIIKYAPSFLEI